MLSAPPSRATVQGEVLPATELLRLRASATLDPARRGALGQFMTPAPVARFMAERFAELSPDVRLLDAGAGVGSLSAALVDELCGRAVRPKSIHIEAWEIDARLGAHLCETLDVCAASAAAAGVRFTSRVHVEDFLHAGVASAERGLFHARGARFNAAILNPPYHKLRSDSVERATLRRIGIEASNVYAGFVAVALELLDDGAELVTITPRSFCNGPYFLPFRTRLLDRVALRELHVFDRRDKAFEDDEVLQETVILRAVTGASRQGPVTVSSRESPGDPTPSVRDIPFQRVVSPTDRARVIHVVSDELGDAVSARMEWVRATLMDLDVQVSTGRVVDFRVRDHLRPTPIRGAAALIYPQHLDAGRVSWPKPEGRKPNALARSADTEALMMPPGSYVLTRRFSSKEEARRIVASLITSDDVRGEVVAFENHLNVFHRGGGPLPDALARGLVRWLNGSLVDSWFRGWSGHTQVNATDLRAMRFPEARTLEQLGRVALGEHPTQAEIDHAIEETIFPMTDRDDATLDPVAAKRRIAEALEVLRALGLPSEQQNERSALTLLALLDLGPRAPWQSAAAPLRGITPMMEFFAERYGKRYAPNTRETVRRFTVHQFVQSGMLLENPDAPKRPTNSPKAAYQVDPRLLATLQTFGSDAWADALTGWLAIAPSLRDRYAQERDMQRVPVLVAKGEELRLSAGGQSDLVKEILHEFCPRFAPGAKVIYVGDTSDKWAYFDADALAALGVKVDEHGKMPDVVVHHRQMNWLLLIEAVTSHGPVNPKRREELAALFKASTAGLVYVTAFMDRRALTRYLPEVAWETEVWVAEAPSHMIHFNGERFLGPY